MKPTLVYMCDGQQVDTKIWPEFSDIHVVDISEEIRDYDSHGMPILAAAELNVISVPEGSEDGLKMLASEVHPDTVACITVRRRPGLWVDWWARLVKSCNGIGVSEHFRHDVCEVMANREFRIGVVALDRCVELVRGSGVDASNEAMRTEKALTKAIEILRATGFAAPRKR